MKTAEITVTEMPSRENPEGRMFTLSLQILDSKIKTKSDILAAIKKAAKHYVTNTKQGKADYEYNCNCFNWADFETAVPNKICQKYGFIKIENTPDIHISVNWNEQLV